MKIEVWSDVVCPWCYLGKRRLEQALAQFGHAGEVTVVWRSFELDPAAPADDDRPIVEHLAEKYGMTVERALESQQRLTELAAADGLEYHLDRTHRANTFDAHRLLHLARERGIQDVAKERFFAAYFTEGERLGDRATLVRLAGEAGLPETEAAAVLGGDAYARQVRADERRAQMLRISGVPFFLVDGRYGLAGAHPVGQLLEALGRAWDEREEVAAGSGAGPGAFGEGGET